jgi:thiol:disulfide interchange protein DsbA
VEVVEFFGYWCPHCANFEPSFHAWTKKVPAHVVVRRNPVAFRDENVPLQRLYFAIEAMDRVDDLHGKVFTAIHGERQRMVTTDEITAWVVKQGVDKDKFLGFYNSFGVAGKVQRAKQLTEAYQVDGVPSLGVGGQYYTSGTQAKSLQRALTVVEHLAEAGRKG